MSNDTNIFYITLVLYFLKTQERLLKLVYEDRGYVFLLHLAKLASSSICYLFKHICMMMTYDPGEIFYFWDGLLTPQIKEKRNHILIFENIRISSCKNQKLPKYIQLEYMQQFSFLQFIRRKPVIIFLL